MAVILLKQTIRNIASIVKADIDYEKGLVDFGTGTPSPLFLISGDTGAGKTAIIDSLSLALYKTTPRISNVVNKNKNSFSDRNGTVVSISDISQYSRIGISHKDDCFTEVEFVDRHRRNCVARLELGYTSKGGYKKPTWTYTVGSDIYNKDADIYDVIKDSIGMTFAQYQHTSVLAQGKFDAFLTGGKEERKLIMEQLTNTEKFTDFGEAISERFKVYKKARESANEKVNNYSVLLLSPQELDDLNSEVATLIPEIELLTKTINDDETRKTTTEKLINALNDKTKAEKRKTQLDEESNSPQHVADVKSVSDWDNTNKERQALNDYDKAVRDIDVARVSLNADEQVFNTLDDDLLFRQESKERMLTQSQSLAEWLNDNSAKQPVYAQEGVITTKMDEHIRLSETICKNRRKLSDEQSKTSQLQQSVNDADQAHKDAALEVDTVKDDIAQLNAAKAALHPADITNDLTAANTRRSLLATLQNTLEQREDQLKVIAAKTNSLTELKTNLNTYKQLCSEAEADYETRRIEAASTNRIYDDVMLSKKETLQNVRAQLALDKADTCPLCGSHVDDWAVNLDAVLEPLKERKRLNDEALSQADLRRKQALSTKSNAEGQLSALETDLLTLQSKLSEITRQIADDVRKAALDESKNLMPQVVAAINDVDSLIAQLNAKNQQVQSLDRQIMDLNSRQTLAQNQLRDAVKAQTKAESALTANATEITRLTDEITEGNNKLNDLVSEINTLLAGHYALWLDDISANILTIRADANDYRTRKDEFDTLAKQLDAATNAINDISATKGNILNLCPSWTHHPSASPKATSNINSDWSRLYSNVFSHVSTINTNTVTRDTNRKLLDDYYSQTGNDEAYLRTLISKTDNIASLRVAINNLNKDMALQQQSIISAVQAIDACCMALAITEPSAMEPLDDIRQRLDESKSALNARNVRLGVVQNQIKSDADNQVMYNDAKADLKQKEQIFEKWKRLNDTFGGNRLCLLVQSYIMKPLLNNANVYLSRITDRYSLTFNNQNEQLSILVLDRYNQNQIRSATVLSGGERFMISLALSLALSALNRSDSNFNILFIDEGFGTLDEKSLDSVMKTLEMLPYITGQTDRRVGIISHIEELIDRIPTQIQVIKQGNGRSDVHTVVR